MHQTLRKKPLSAGDRRRWASLKMKETLIKVRHLMNKYLDFISLIFLGADREPYSEDRIGFHSLRKYLHQAWSANSFGIFRVFQLSLEFAKIAFPSFWITLFLGKKKANVVDFSNDVWGLVRIAFLIIMLWWVPSGNWQAWLVIYLIADIFVYVSRLVFLSDIYEPTLTPERTLLFLLVNYFEIVLGFAFLHRVYGGLNVGSLCPIQALYFSFVTSTTLGYGEIVPVSSDAQLRIIIQLAITFVFITALVGALLGRLNSSLKK